MDRYELVEMIAGIVMGLAVTAFIGAVTVIAIVMVASFWLG